MSNDDLAGGITNAKLAGGITNDKLAGGITLDKLAANSVDASKIVDGSVGTAELADGSVTTAKIRDGNVTNPKIGDGSINNPKIVNGAVDESKLANNSVSSVKIVNGAVNTDKIATRAVTNIKIEDGTIGRGKMAFNTVVSVGAGAGLNGGGEVRDPSLSVDFNSVARSSHTHNQYASTNHTHSGQTTGTVASDPPVPGHTHTISGLGNVSTRALKKDIEDYEVDPEKILNLSLKRFRYLNHARRFQLNLGNRDWSYGYIAEEVLDSGLEELLIYDDQGKPFGLNYALVGVLSLELVRSLKNRVELLEQKVLELDRSL